MYRILSGVARYFADLAATSRRAWCAFFFTPADPISLGLIRIMVGLLLLWDIAILGVDLPSFLGSDGWIGPEAARAYLAHHSPWAWSFWLLVPDSGLYAAWAVCLVILVLFTLGLGSRATAVLAWVIAVSTARRAPAVLFGFDQTISTWVFYLAVFGASGQSLSLDRLLARNRAARAVGSSRHGRQGSEAADLRAVIPMPTVSANLSLRMIQLHLALVYGSAGLSKLMGPEWWNGTALEMIILTPEFRRFDLAWLAAFPLLLNLGTHAGLLLEISYPVLVWVRPLRPLVLVSMALMHFGIDLLLGLTEFGLAMIAANLAFVSGTWIRTMAASTHRPAERNGTCEARSGGFRTTVEPRTRVRARA
jgi:hypothetical protein